MVTREAFHMADEDHAPAVDTRKVTGRRQLRFNALEDIRAEAERLAVTERLRTLGNWNLAQALAHVARTMEGSLDGFSFRAPWFLRLLGPLIKKRMLTRPMPGGFRLPGYAGDLLPDKSVTLGEALDAVRGSIERLKQEDNRQPHVVLGRLSREEWDQLHQRHAELHLSFFLPEVG